MKTTILIYVVSVLLAVGITYFVTKPDVEPVVSGVTVGNEYNYVSVTPVSSAPAMLKTGPGAFGSFIISTAGTGRLILYDATTTQSTLRTIQATSSLPIVATIEPSQAVGDYVYDVVFNGGLLIDYVGTQGTSTITYR